MATNGEQKFVAEDERDNIEEDSVKLIQTNEADTISQIKKNQQKESIHSTNTASSIHRSHNYKESSQSKRSKRHYVARNNCQSLMDDDSSKSLLKQAFPSIDCLPAENNIVLCYVLCAWNNIVGPQTVYVWKQSSKSKPASRLMSRTSSATEIPVKQFSSQTCSKTLSQTMPDNSSYENMKKREKSSIDHVRLKLHLSEIIKFVTEHSVGAIEIQRSIDNKLVTFYLSMPHKRIGVYSVRFNLMEEEVGLPYCLSGVIHIDDEEKFLPYLDMTLDSMQRASVKIRLMVAKGGLEAGAGITPDLVELTDTLSSLTTANLSVYPSTNIPTAPTDRHFAELMLTSHLQTGGYTIIAADSPNSGNKVALWLSMFSSPDSENLSRFAFSSLKWPYQTGPKIQVIIKDITGALDVSSMKLVCFGRPLTMIDLTTNTVRQKPLSAHYRNMSSSALKTQLAKLWFPSSNFGAPSQCLLEKAKVVSPLVKKLLKECDYLSSCSVDVRRKYIKYFRRSLYYTALAVVTYIRQTSETSAKKKDKSSLKQDILSAFQLDNTDLKVILSFAEDFEPGVTSFVY